MQKTAVAGFGCAGYHAVRSMREHGYQGEIDVYTDTQWAPANPMLTTYYICGKLRREATLPFGAIEELSQKYNFHIITTSVQKVLSEEKAVLLQDGKTQYYDQILISTGARAFVPPIPGHEGERVFSMRTIEDADHVRKILEGREIKRAVVVGASMVGIKLVELLYARGIHCTLVDMAPYIFPLAAVPCVAAEIERRLTGMGVELAFSKALKAIEEDGQRVVFADGERISCDMVLMCIGTRANTEIADENIKVNRGIVVDKRMRTNMQDIYCAGDCSEGCNLQTGDNQIIGIWDNAARQGETAGANMAGVVKEYEGNMLHNITHFMGMDFIGFGDVKSEGEEFLYENKEKGETFVIRVKDNKPVCMNFLDSYGASGVLKAYMINKFGGAGRQMDSVSKVRLLNEGIPEKLINFLESNGQEEDEWEK